MENISKIQAFASKFNETNLALSPTIIADARNTLLHLDFPTTKNESWKYTRLAKLAQLRLKQNNIIAEKQIIAPLTDNGIVRITNGYITSFSKEIAGLKITPFSKCSEQQLSLIGKKVDLKQNIFLALNTLYLQEGLFIEVEENAQIEGVFQVLFHAHGENCFAPFRVFIHVKKGSSFKLIQQFTASGEHLFSLPILEYLIEENARISCDKLQMENASSFLLCEDYSIQKRNSTVLLNTFSMSGAWVRNNSSFLIEGENCETNLNGAYLLKDLQHLDNHTIVDHIAPHCNSNELYKGILSGKATGVFNGKVFVRPNAQKISAFQSNANVLLSDDASVNSKPELEIYANDVKCSHGSTTGQLDEDAVFYLRARGLSEKSARSLITQAFITEVVDKVEQKEVRDFIQNKLVELHDWTN